MLDAVRKIVLYPLALLAMFAVPQPAGAVALGAIEVRSHLNEPFEARIALSGLKAGELDNLRVALAAESSFERAGLKRSYLLTRLKFSTQALSNGRAFIRVRSREAIREPGLSFIVEATSSGASFERRYDVLINLR